MAGGRRCGQLLRQHRPRHPARPLRKRIDDERFIRLVAGMLKAGYMEDWTFHTTFSGTPQGGVALADPRQHLPARTRRVPDDDEGTVRPGRSAGEKPALPQPDHSIYKRRLRVDRAPRRKSNRPKPRPGKSKIRELRRRNAPPCRRRTGSTRTSGGCSSAAMPMTSSSA